MNEMKDLDGKEKLVALSEILIECSDHDESFWTFAIDNEDAVRVALYAKNVTDGHATATEELISECDKAIEVLQGFLDEADSEEQ